ncbi:MAG: hypothetical protein GY705_12300 [Bacteroidetes bacterium]|nr:hypothetical protein [Bacteroidota bacterium]
MPFVNIVFVAYIVNAVRTAFTAHEEFNAKSGVEFFSSMKERLVLFDVKNVLYRGQVDERVEMALEELQEKFPW